MPTPDRRQLVFYVLAYLRYAESQGTPAALQALLALRDQCRATPLDASSLSLFAATWDY